MANLLIWCTKGNEFLLYTYILLSHSLTEEGKCLKVSKLLIKIFLLLFVFFIKDIKFIILLVFSYCSKLESITLMK
jgi:hypothetical protein